MSDSKNIWVYAECAGDGPASVVLELLAKAQELKAKTGDAVVAVLLGSQTGKAADDLLAFGADQVIRVESKDLAPYKPLPYAEVLCELVRKYKPSIFLFGATSQGRDLAPRLQGKLLTGLTSDCLGLDIDDKGILVQTKPSYGDNIMCTILCPDARPQMATVRPKVFSPLARKPDAKGEIVDEKLAVKADDTYEVVASAPLAASTIDITASDFIISLGRGAKTEAAITAARQIADLLHGAVAVTRPLTDDGTFSHDSLIGQSGFTVKPKCIVNFGISGAVQYTVGMQESGLIVAVNKNKDAPIFGLSHIGVVGDAEEVLKAIVEELRRVPQ